MKTISIFFILLSLSVQASEVGIQSLPKSFLPPCSVYVGNFLVEGVQDSGVCSVSDQVITSALHSESEDPNIPVTLSDVRCAVVIYMMTFNGKQIEDSDTCYVGEEEVRSHIETVVNTPIMN